MIEPHCPKVGNGRPPVGLDRTLRMYFVRHCCNLADAACEDALLDCTVLRRFIGINLGRERVPQTTTLLKFRRPLESHKLGEALQASGMKVGASTIVDASIIGSPSSTKNADKQRDPEMHQTRKGQRWYFGIKLHIGVDSETGLVHSAVVTATNVHDEHPLPDLLHGQEERVYGDCAYASQHALIRGKAPKAEDFTSKTMRKASPTEELERMVNRAKSRVRARVEHAFGVFKRLWGLDKARYRGLAKNGTRAFAATALANLFLARMRLAA